MLEPLEPPGAPVITPEEELPELLLLPLGLPELLEELLGGAVITLSELLPPGLVLEELLEELPGLLEFTLPGVPEEPEV